MLTAALYFAAEPARAFVGAPTFDTVVYTGQQVPGAAAGVTFRHLGRPASLNDHGQIALYGEIQGTGVTFDNDAGMWSGDPR